jgi:hypothetical protein
VRRAAAVVAAALAFTPGLARAQGATLTESSPPPPSTPPPTAPTPQGDQAQGQKLSNEEKKDSGRILELVWANVEGGFSYINMNGFSTKNLGLQNTTSAGGLFGLGAGIRLFILTLGIRLRLNDLSAFSFWEINGELGFHIPAGHWDPYFSLHGGYTFSGSLGDAFNSQAASASAANSVDIHGGDAGLSIGCDYYFLKVLSLGLDVTGQGLFLSRPAAQVAGLPAQDQMLLNQTGDSIGFGISGSAHLGLHI